MSNDIDAGVFSDHQGIVGENFGLAHCDSCDEWKDHGVDVVGDTPLGDLLQVEDVEVDTPNGTETVAGTQTLCDECIEHLIEAKKQSEA